MPGGYPCDACKPSDTCIYFQDEFDREDSTDLGVNWTETAGDWSISGGKLVTASPDAIASCLVAHPDIEFEYWATVKVAGEAGDVVRLYVNGGLQWAELEFPASVELPGRLRLYDGGALVGCTDAKGADLIEACVSGGRLQVTAGSGQLSTPVTAESSLCAVGTGGQASGASFDDLKLARIVTKEGRGICRDCYPDGCVIAADDYCCLSASEYETVSGTWTRYGNDMAGYFLRTDGPGVLRTRWRLKESTGIFFSMQDIYCSTIVRFGTIEYRLILSSDNIMDVEETISVDGRVVHRSCNAPLIGGLSFYVTADSVRLWKDRARHDALEVPYVASPGAYLEIEATPAPAFSSYVHLGSYRVLRTADLAEGCYTFPCVACDALQPGTIPTAVRVTVEGIGTFPEGNCGGGYGYGCAPAFTVDLPVDWVAETSRMDPEKGTVPVYTARFCGSVQTCGAARVEATLTIDPTEGTVDRLVSVSDGFGTHFTSGVRSHDTAAWQGAIALDPASFPVDGASLGGRLPLFRAFIEGDYWVDGLGVEHGYDGCGEHESCAYRDATCDVQFLS